MFCLCGPRGTDQNEKSQDTVNQQIATSLQANMKRKSMKPFLNLDYTANVESSINQQFTQRCDQSREYKEYTDFINGYYQGNNQKSQIQLPNDTELSAIKYEETKTSNEQMRLIHLGDGLLAKIISINQATTSSCKDSFSPFIMKVLNETKRFYDINPIQEVQFVKQLVPHFITEQTYQRVKNDKLLIAHDPTGSFLIKHTLSNQEVFYIQESKTYRNILNYALDILKSQDKVNYIFKSDITDKLDTVILNLLYIQDTPISFVIQEYLTLAHDMIIILSPKIDYHEMVSQLRQGIKQSAQSRLYCSIEIQNVYNGGQFMARIIYYGEVSQITQNQQLSYLYECISKNMKKIYKYKKLIKDLKNQVGIMKLVDLFALYGLLNNQSEENFTRFYQQMKLSYFQNFQSSVYKFQKAESNQSQTESENEDPVPLVQYGSSIIFSEIKLYSKSLSTHAAKSEYVHFHSQNNNQNNNTKNKAQDKIELTESCIYK
ncbi:unnamed protein product [Paramecium primaurelia]|uniref:Uncharacterized protein n=1 Tax=Paramecium primaurelia TaxID=5886 RepID=A0A8S1KS49_PARPR|nr:unnamed protein product [Paramecium primaurelia]